MSDSVTLLDRISDVDYGIPDMMTVGASVIYFGVGLFLAVDSKVNRVAPQLLHIAYGITQTATTKWRWNRAFPKSVLTPTRSSECKLTPT